MTCRAVVFYLPRDCRIEEVLYSVRSSSTPNDRGEVRADAPLIRSRAAAASSPQCKHQDHFTVACKHYSVGQRHGCNELPPFTSLRRLRPLQPDCHCKAQTRRLPPLLFDFLRTQLRNLYRLPISRPLTRLGILSSSRLDVHERTSPRRLAFAPLPLSLRRLVPLHVNCIGGD